MLITENKMRRIFPRANEDFIIVVTHMLNRFGPLAGIKTKKQLAMFLANVKHEVGFKKNGQLILRENLNYKRDTLAKLSKRFRKNPSLLDKAMKLKGKEKQKFIAVNWYGYGKKARTLGNKKPIDGWKYRGFGLLQVTGRGITITCFREAERIFGITCIDKKTGEVLPGMFGLAGAVFSSLGYWSLYVKKCKTMKCSINKINYGLPKSFKKKRIKTYKKVLNILVSE